MKNEKYLTPKEALEYCTDDIVAIAMDEDRKWYCYFNKLPKAYEQHWSIAVEGLANNSVLLPLNIKYDGDWKDSLTVREKPFEITETGLYKTHDGRKVFISCVKPECVKGVIEGTDILNMWTIKGIWQDVVRETDYDIISKWTEE